MTPNAVDLIAQPGHVQARRELISLLEESIALGAPYDGPSPDSMSRDELTAKMVALIEQARRAGVVSERDLELDERDLESLIGGLPDYDGPSVVVDADSMSDEELGAMMSASPDANLYESLMADGTPARQAIDAISITEHGRVLLAPPSVRVMPRAPVVARTRTRARARAPRRARRQASRLVAAGADPPPPGDPPPDLALDALARALAPRIAPLIARLLGLAPREDHLVDVARAIPAPRKTLYRACREGGIQGAAVVGRRWLARQSAIDDYLRARGPRVVEDSDEDGDEFEELRARFARPVPGRRR